eukprot:1621371-Amphidinium_carterae.1
MKSKSSSSEYLARVQSFAGKRMMTELLRNRRQHRHDAIVPTLTEALNPSFACGSSSRPPWQWPPMFTSTSDYNKVLLMRQLVEQQMYGIESSHFLQCCKLNHTQPLPASQPISDPRSSQYPNFRLSTSPQPH